MLLQGHLVRDDIWIGCFPVADLNTLGICLQYFDGFLDTAVDWLKSLD